MLHRACVWSWNVNRLTSYRSFNLRARFLRVNKGFMHVPEDVINRITIPTDPEDKFMYYSEQLTAVALTQIYVYIIKNGLEYSKVVSGEADVFL